MGARAPSARKLEYERERAVLFGLVDPLGLVEPPRRRDQLVATLKRVSLLVAAAFVAMFGAPAAVAVASTLTYTTAPELVRDINAANTSAGTVTAIDYVDAAGGHTTPTTLTFSAPLPAVTEPISLNGYGVVTLADTFTTPAGDGLELASGSDGSTVSGIAITGASGPGLGVLSSGDTINGDTFTHNTGDGVLLNGGNDTLMQSLISGNGGDGVQINGDGNQLNGNDIGTDANGFTGNLDLNGSEGVMFGAGTHGDTILQGVIAGGNDTFTLDAGGGANHVKQASLIGDPAPLIGDGQNMSLTSGALAQPVGAPPTYPVAVSGGQANDTVTVQLFSASCSGDVAKLQYLSAGTGTLNGAGGGTVNVPAPNGAPSLPVFLADGQNAGVNNLPDPCSGSPPPPPPPPSPPPPPPPPSSSLACPAWPKSASPGFVASGTPDSRWLRAVYHDLLNRSPSAGDLGYWTSLLNLGVTREQVVLAIEQSGESRQGLVDQVFQSYLNRSPSSAEAGFWASQLSGGLTDEQFKASVLGSPEFFSDAGGTTPSFVSGLYSCLLSRTPAASELQAGLVLLSGGVTKAQLAATFLSSHEYEADLVGSWYLRFLRRAADSGALALVTALSSGASDEQVIAAILGSTEYWHEFTPTTLKIVTISAGGAIHLTLAHPGTVALEVLKLLKPGTSTLPAVQHTAADASSFRLPKLKRLGVVNFGRQRKGRHVLHWNRRVGGKRLGKGKYELVIQIRHGGKLIDSSDAIRFTVP